MMTRAIGFILFLILVAISCPAQTLREYANKRGLLIGTAVQPARFSEPEYANTLAREFNLVEPENAMKWAAIRPTRDTFNFKPGDQVVEFAKVHRMKVRGHCLLWSEYNPDWLEKGQLQPEELSKLLKEHVTVVMKHYAGKVFAWDVVNEAFEADGDIEPSIWYDSPGIGLKEKGTAYIEQAFRWARAGDPKALLFYNDYDAEGLNAKSDAIYAMVKDFKQRRVPIDGVGLQMHIFKLSTNDIAELEKNIQRLTSLGLEVHITEMDVALPLNEKRQLSDRADLTRQAEIYRFVANACFSNPKCTVLQTWGFTDKYSWVPRFTKFAKGAALLFDESYGPKPSYRALLDTLSQPKRSH